MISFYIEETETPVAKEKYFVLWMKKDGKKYFVDDTFDYLDEESDAELQKKMAQLYSTDGVYYGSEDDIVEFADRIRNNNYHFGPMSDIILCDLPIDNTNFDKFYLFIGRIVETGEEFEFCIYDIMSPEISRAKIDLLLKERKKVNNYSF